MFHDKQTDRRHNIGKMAIFPCWGKGKGGGARSARGRAAPKGGAGGGAGGAYILRDTTGSDFSTQIASSTQRVTHGMRRFSMILSIQDDFLGKKHL